MGWTTVSRGNAYQVVKDVLMWSLTPGAKASGPLDGETNLPDAGRR